MAVQSTYISPFGPINKMAPGRAVDWINLYMFLASFLAVTNRICLAQCIWNPRSNCRCEYNDGSVLDFSKISKSNGDPWFDFGSYGSTGDFVYAFNPCHGFTSGKCSNVAGCQRYKNEDYFDIGDPFPVSWTSPSDTTQLVVYRSTQGGNQRETWVTYTCDETGKIGEPKLSFKDEFPTNRYNFDLLTCLACKQDIPDCPKGGGGGGGGVSVGGLLCILFTVAVVVYIVGGLLFMKFARGAEGKEMIPNYAFWLDFPSLVKDGFLFVISPCKKGSYQSME